MNSSKVFLAVLPFLAVSTASLAAGPPGPPQRATVFSGTGARSVLNQCSRTSPQPGQRFFRPNRGDISSLDRAVIESGRKLPEGARTFSELRSNYAVDVIGMVRSGRRLVYGSYYPIVLQDGMKYASPDPTIVCDGGSRFFGAEIDTATGRITHFAFNGR